MLHNGKKVAVIILFAIAVLIFGVALAQILPSFGTSYSLNGWIINTESTGTVLLDNQPHEIDAHGTYKPQTGKSISSPQEQVRNGMLL